MFLSACYVTAYLRAACVRGTCFRTPGNKGRQRVCERSAVRASWRCPLSVLRSPLSVLRSPQDGEDRPAAWPPPGRPRVPATRAALTEPGPIPPSPGGSRDSPCPPMVRKLSQVEEHFLLRRPSRYPLHQQEGTPPPSSLYSYPPSVSIVLGSRVRGPPSGWLTQQKCLPSQFRRLEA